MMKNLEEAQNNNRLLNILVDFAFKKVFAGESEKSHRILIDFLNSILELKDANKVKEIIYLNPFNDREHERDKQSIMDIKVKTDKGELIDIEVQINDVDDYKKRSLYYWSKLYAETLTKGKFYYDLKKSIVINILDFNLISENNKFHNIFEIKERDDNFLFIEDLEIHYIELNKFNTIIDLDNLNDLEEWIVFLRECSPSGDIEIIEKLSKKKEEIGEAMEIMNKLSADELEYQQYLAREKYLMDEMSKKKYAEHKMKEIENKLKEAQKAEQQAKEAVQQAKEAEQQAKEAEQQAKEAEQQAKEAEQQAKEAEQQAKEDAVKVTNKVKEVLINQITKKFNNISEEYVAKISAAPMDSINRIAEDIFDLQSVEELNKYL